MVLFSDMALFNPGGNFRSPQVEAHLDEVTVEEGFTREANVAQYKGSDYTNAVRVERGITLEKAFEIAKSDPEIDYFVFTKGEMMVLEIPSDVEFNEANDPLHLVTESQFIYDNGQAGSGYCRTFTHGDVVFFKNEGKWLSSAPNLADVYLKQK